MASSLLYITVSCSDYRLSFTTIAAGHRAASLFITVKKKQFENRQSETEIASSLSTFHRLTLSQWSRSAMCH